MDGKKVYQIQINGISESISAVDALNKQLDALEKRIKALENSNVKVNTTSKGGGGNASVLNEEAAVQKEINKLKQEGATLDAKIIAAQDEVYKKVDATKQLYKETVADQKALAAQERLTADAYSNTMQGMKSQLADLKAVINTTDIGDSDKIKQMTQQANELTTKLKQMEEAYGQFGRNVGNYQDAANGFKGLAIQVGDVTQKFDNAKQALKELKKERDTLAVKSELGIISEEEAKRLKDLIPTVAQLQSAIQDAGKPMDALMDTMQSFVAITQVSKGLGAFFGFDNAEIDKTIKNLVALQNAMQGLQTIQKQIQERQGVGAWIAPFTVQIDKATAKLLTFNTALLGTGKAAKVAGVAIKGFSKALKAALSIGILVVVDLLVEKLMDLVDSFKKVDEAAERDKEVQKDLAEAYGQAQGKLIQYKTKVDSFNGSKKEEKKLVEELNKEFGDTLGTYNSLAEWQDVLKQKGEAYIQTLINQAKAQAALNEVTAAYMNLESVKQKAANGDYSHWYQSRQQDAEAAARAIEEANQRIAKAEENLANTIKANDEYAKENGVGNYAPKITKNGQKTKKAVDDVQKTLNELEMRLMKEGLNKKLRQLDEEERQTINKLQENGRKSGIEIQKIQRAYAQLRAKEIQEYLKTLDEIIRKSAQDIKKVQFEINTKDIDNQIDELQNKFDELAKNVPHINDLITAQDFSTSLVEKGFEKTIRDVSSGVYAVKINWDEDDIRKMFQVTTDMLKSGFVSRNNAAKQYYDETIKQLKENIKQQSKLNEDAINERKRQLEDAEGERYSIQMSGLTKTRKDIDLGLQAIEKQYKVRGLEGIETIKDTNNKIYEQYHELFAQGVEVDADIQAAKKQHKTKMLQITKEANNAIKKNEIDTLNEIQAAQQRYYDIQLSNYRDFQSKLNDEISKNPVVFKDWGIVNINQTRKNYDEIIKASDDALKQIEADKEKLEKDFNNGKGLISKEAYNATKNQLNDLEKEIKNGMAVTEEANANLIADFVSSIQMYLQAAMDSFSTIMNAVWDAQDVAFDKEQEQLDKDNEALEEALNKQQEIVEKHKSAIDSIEDELATSRGDRRQHLIDQLNAEMEAQRRAAEEEKRIQKEKEAIEKRQDELEKERKKAQYKRDLLQAIVNGAMAVTMAAINTWPIPAIPMMALAASTTAAQVAIMAANKPYAKGGLLEGPSHREGGIPVGNTGIEVEGKEYVIRKRSTAQNIDLLDYINKSERKLDLSDFIDFYSSKVKKSITSSSPRSKFADGGAIPMLNNEYQFDDRLLSAFEDYSNRPVYVSVVDINSRQAAVKNVQVLAGLGE